VQKPPLLSFRAHTLLAFAAVYFIWGSTFLAIHFALATIPPFILGALRFLIAGTVLWFLGRPSSTAPVTTGEKDRSLYWKVPVSGLLLFTSGNGSLLYAEQTMPSGIAALICATIPVFIALLRQFFFKEQKIKPRTALAFLLGMTGIWLLTHDDLGGGATIRDTLIVLVGVVSWGYASLWGRSFNNKGPSLFRMVSLQMLSAAAGFFLLHFATGEYRHFDWNGMSLLSFGSVLYLAIPGSVIAFTAYFWLLKTQDPEKIATYAFVNPLIAVVLGSVFAGEALNFSVFLSSGLILLSLGLVLFGERIEKFRKRTLKSLEQDVAKNPS
jgi:drug/metabolite transporter (DMT)-like permease